jgi:hypothetical protein
MTDARRRLQILITVAVSLIVLAAPARGGDWFGFHVGPGGFSLSFGSTDWTVYGSAWHNPGWSVDYHVALAGYGEWVWVDGLGQCWRPWVATAWRPYTHGRWVWTCQGWTWVAYEPWGYFPHHYGHWALSSYGWVWSPGYVYRPANVVWVGAGGYVGWYASPPPGWSHARRGWHRGWRHGYERGWSDGYSSGWHDAQHATYTRWQHFGADDLSRHAVPHHSVATGRTAAAVRAGVAAPDRTVLAGRGVRTPELEIESRVVRVGDRRVTVTRPSGVEAAVRRHAEPTVRRALSRDAQNTAAARARSDRAAPTARGSDAPSVNSASRSTTNRSRPASSPSGEARRPTRSRSAPDPATVVSRAPAPVATDRAIRGSRSTTPSTRSSTPRTGSGTPSASDREDRRPAPSAISRNRSNPRRSAPTDIRPGNTSARPSRESASSRQPDRRTAPSAEARSQRDSRTPVDTRSRRTATERQRPSSASSRSADGSSSSESRRSTADARSPSARSRSNDRTTDSRRPSRKRQE